MYELLKKHILRLLRVPPEPEDPMGDVNSLLVFRASWNFFRYRFLIWIVTNTIGTISLLLVPLLGLWAIYMEVEKKGKSHPLSFTTIMIILAGLLLYALIQLFISYIALRLDYELRWYKVSDRSLRIREGVFNVRELTMTFANIQNIEIIQGPVQRLFGIADLKVETAGGGSLSQLQQGNNRAQLGYSFHVAYFRGIENAIEIRNLMRSRLEKIRSAGLGDEIEDKEFVSSSPSVDAVFDDEYLELLRELRNEASLLRQAFPVS